MKSPSSPSRRPRKALPRVPAEERITLRTRARIRDRSDLKKILVSTRLFYPYEIDVAIDLLDDQIKWKEDSIFSFIFADRNGQCAGYVCYGPIQTTDNRYDMYWIAVRKDLQGMGIGKRLVDETEKRISEKKGKIIYVETSSREDYEPTRAFYLRNGYIEVARVPHYYKDNDDMIILMKTLPT
jgi:ribosomal protein S18 acetylase RimI-like enzyme